MNTIAQMGDEEEGEWVKELAVIRAYEQRHQSLAAFHRRMEAEAREREAESIERATPAFLGLGAIWLLCTLWKHRRR